MTVGWRGAERGAPAARRPRRRPHRRADARRDPRAAGRDPARVRAALAGRPSVHLITNTRALPAERVCRFIADATRAALEGAPGAAVVLRGDSTLRGHSLEEYLGVRDVVAPAGRPVLLLAPALPSAGRVTVGGVHLFDRDGRRTALHETEYARDGVFAYSTRGCSSGRRSGRMGTSGHVPAGSCTSTCCARAGLPP